jgi:hypothetical protein
MSGAAPNVQAANAALRPVLEELEAERRRALSRVTLAWGAAGLAAAAAALAAFALQRFGLFVVTALALAAGGAFAAHFTRTFAAAFKARVIGPIVSAFNPTFRYEPAGGISREEFLATGLFQHRIDRYSREDLVRGRVGQTAVRFSEVHAQYKTESRDSKGRRHTHWHTIFKGLFFVGDFNKHFAGATYVLPDTAQRLFGSFGQTLQSWSSSHGELVKLEDPEFERAFAVFSTDQLEARYILSPSLMRRLLDYKSRSDAAVYFAFVASSVVVALSLSRDLFEPSLSRSLLDPGLLGRYWDDLELAAGLVEELDLNTRIWTKA